MSSYWKMPCRRLKMPTSYFLSILGFADQVLMLAMFVKSIELLFLQIVMKLDYDVYSKYSPLHERAHLVLFESLKISVIPGSIWDHKVPLPDKVSDRLKSIYNDVLDPIMSPMM